MVSSTDAQVKAGAKCIIAQDTDFRGDITFGNGTVVHPRAIIHSLGGGEIEIGSECIIEEFAQIVHRSQGKMVIGDRNLFEASCRVESPRVGSHNTFEPRSRSLESVAIQNFTTVGAGCVAQPPATWYLMCHEKERILPESEESHYTFPSRTVIFGQVSQARSWSGNGVRQADALHMKHLDYLRESECRY
ncbi:hypothetical protein CBS101457_001943 [Exobasidium rhododendri]|nr:hypothetical protein CBS101457_001943 [Exobasidium rhododendri]